MQRSPALVAHLHAPGKKHSKEKKGALSLSEILPPSQRGQPVPFGVGGSLLLAAALLGTGDMPQGMQAEAAGDQPCALVQPLALPCIHLKCCEVRGMGWGMLSKTCLEPLLDKSPWNLT